ncbi:MAG: transporter substrate-binding domain-containing protein [Spirochaetales bacterium]|nr:transporter substrate-binding domain-containing protein [Spirochaetales bacterium]
MNNYIRKFLLVTALYFLLSQALISQEIVILCSENYRPYSYYDKNNTARGIYPEILEELFARADLPLHVELMPFKRVLLSLGQGYADGMAGVFYTEERARYSNYLLDVPLSHISNSLFTLKDSSLSSSEMKELEGLSLGRKRGFFVSTEFNEAAELRLFSLIEAESVDQLIHMTLSGRLDGFAHTTNNALYHIEALSLEDKIKNFPISHGEESTRKTYLALTRSKPQFWTKEKIALLTLKLKEMERDGTIEAIYARNGVSYDG